MGVNGKIGAGICGIGFLLIVTAIVLSMLGLVSAGATVGMVVSALCIPGLYIAFQSWDEEAEVEEEELPLELPKE